MDQSEDQAGRARKVITGIPGKTGIVYTLDRRTGEFLWARPTVMQNVVSKIDGATGKVTVNPEDDLHREGQTKLICPGSNGGKNWPAGAYSPTTNAMYMPAAEHVHERHDDGGYARSVEGLRTRHAGRDRAGREQRRQRVGDLGRDRQDPVEARAARGRAVAGRDRRRAGLRRRRERTLPRVRRSQRQGAVGSESPARRSADSR